MTVELVRKELRTIKVPVLTVTSANYTILTDDGYEVISVSTGASARTITLPDAAANKGRKLMIQRSDATAGGSVIISRAGTDLIDGLTSETLLGQYGFAKLLSTGSAWILEDLIDSGTWTPTTNSQTNITGTLVYNNPKWQRTGRMVRATIDSITASPMQITTGNSSTLTLIVFTTAGLPSIVNATQFSGTAYSIIATAPNELIPTGVTFNSGANTHVSLQLDASVPTMLSPETINIRMVTVRYRTDE